MHNYSPPSNCCSRVTFGGKSAFESYGKVLISVDTVVYSSLQKCSLSVKILYTATTSQLIIVKKKKKKFKNAKG